MVLKDKSLGLNKLLTTALVDRRVVSKSCSNIALLAMQLLGLLWFPHGCLHHGHLPCHLHHWPCHYCCCFHHLFHQHCQRHHSCWPASCSLVISTAFFLRKKLYSSGTLEMMITSYQVIVTNHSLLMLFSH